jgi:polyphosphate kinase
MAVAREPLSAKAYAKELKALHVELVKLQEWVRSKGLKVCILFEGRDGAGKGGTIKALTERVSPRVFRDVALPAPTEREKSQIYLQRYALKIMDQVVARLSKRFGNKLGGPAQT